jgi:hypothetical protein
MRRKLECFLVDIVLWGRSLSYVLHDSEAFMEAVSHMTNHVMV